MAACFLLETESAPLAHCWAVNVSLIKLNVLDWMAESKLVDSHAPGSVAVDLYDRQGVDQLFSVGTVTVSRYL